MWFRPINYWIYWYNSIWIYSFMAEMIMAYNMIKICCFFNSSNLIKFSRIIPNIWIINNTFSIAFKMQNINAVKAY